MRQTKMALLLGCGKWEWGKMEPREKMDAFQRFLADNPKAVWRWNGNYREYLHKNIQYPLNLYFYWDSIIRFRANCIDIQRHDNKDWPRSTIPPEFHNDPEQYVLGTFIDKLELVVETHIKDFPKWDSPETHYNRGLRRSFGVVQDIFVAVKK